MPRSGFSEKTGKLLKEISPWRFRVGRGRRAVPRSAFPEKAGKLLKEISPWRFWVDRGRRPVPRSAFPENEKDLKEIRSLEALGQPRATAGAAEWFPRKTGKLLKEISPWRFWVGRGRRPVPRSAFPEKTRKLVKKISPWRFWVG